MHVATASYLQSNAPRDAHYDAWIYYAAILDMYAKINMWTTTKNLGFL